MSERTSCPEADTGGVPPAARTLNDLSPAVSAVRNEAFTALRTGLPVEVGALAARTGQELEAVQTALISPWTPCREWERSKSTAGGWSATTGSPHAKPAIASRSRKLSHLLG